jgi:hypothetical protein
LVHFISEAKRHNQIVEADAFGSSPSKAFEQTIEQRRPHNQTHGAQNTSSAFGSFKMNAVVQPSSPPTAQPSNMQSSSFGKQSHPNPSLE